MGFHSSPVGMSHGRRSVRSLGGAAARLPLARCEETATTQPRNKTTARQPQPTPAADPAAHRRALPPCTAVRPVVVCVVEQSGVRASGRRAPTGTSGRPTDGTTGTAPTQTKRIAEVTGPCLRPPQRTSPPPTYTPARGALTCFVLPCVGSCAAASCAERACVFVRTEPTPLAACLAGSAGGRRAEVTRTGGDGVRERAPAEVRVLPRGLNPRAGLGVPEEQEAEQAAGHHQQMGGKRKGGYWDRGGTLL